MGAAASRWDVAVVGGGPAGSTTAALLARKGYRVVLLDRARFPRAKPCAEYASPGTLALLERLGVLPTLPSTAVRPLRGVRLHSPRGHTHLVEYRRDGEPALAASVSRWELDAALVERARQAGVEVREGHTVLGLARAAGAAAGVVARDPVGGTVEVAARLVVGADGVRSAVARDLGVGRTAGWPGRLGLVAHLRDVPWPEDVGAMHVGRTSYVGLAPLGDGTVSVGLVRPLPRGRLGVPEAALRAELNRFPAVAERVAGAPTARPVQGLGPVGHAVRRASGPGWLLVGDAAGFFDPFTGEGIYRALRGAELAAGFADRALAAGRGVVDVGPGYAAARRVALRPKELLTRLVQLFVREPGLMDYALPRLAARPAFSQPLANVLGDLQPAAGTLRPGFLWGLLGP